MKNFYNQHVLLIKKFRIPVFATIFESETIEKAGRL